MAKNGTLPIMQSDNQDLIMMQNRWATILNPIVSAPVAQGYVLQGISLQIGTNSINHLLGRKLQGWMLTRKRADAAIYDTQDSNAIPNLTLQLVSDAAVMVDIYVF